MHDLVIENVRVVDGTGAPSFIGAVAVKDGVIAAVGDRIEGDAAETIDGGGLVLMPGIIDGHTHYDAQVTWDPYVDPSPRLGVTTVIMGNCGFTIAPCRADNRDLTMRNLTHVEGMPIEALRSGIRWDFEKFDEYLDMIEKDGLGVNVGVFVGHSAVRTYVMGEDAAKRKATPEEIQKMADIVRSAMKAGAVGFSSTLNAGHNGEGGIPMPSRLASKSEFEALTCAMAESKRGVVMITDKRGSGDDPSDYEDLGPAGSIHALDELAQKHGRTTLLSAFLENPLDPGGSERGLQRLREARERGSMIYGEVSCVPLTMEFELPSAYVFETTPGWRPIMEAHDRAALPKFFNDPAFRAKLKEDFLEGSEKRLFTGNWTKLSVVATQNPELAKFEGRTLAEIAQAEGKHPVDAMLDIGLADDLKTLFVAQLRNSDEDRVAPLLSDPESYITLSDAGAHVTFLCDAGFGLHLLGRWSRELGVFTIEEAARRLTSQPAKLFGIKDRGTLKPGLRADLMLFDPETVERGPSRRAYDMPGGVYRLVCDGAGVHGVWVNGVRVVTDGTILRKERPGQLMREYA